MIHKLFYFLNLKPKYECIECVDIDTNIPFYRTIKRATILERMNSELYRTFQIFDLQGHGVFHYENGENAPSKLWELATAKYKDEARKSHRDRNAETIKRLLTMGVTNESV